MPALPDITYTTEVSLDDYKLAIQALRHLVAAIDQLEDVPIPYNRATTLCMARNNAHRITTAVRFEDID
jgi:hypothetical protein